VQAEREEDRKVSKGAGIGRDDYSRHVKRADVDLHEVMLGLCRESSGGCDPFRSHDYV
jgi:hypothetical protein